ncbi:MICAL-like protein 1 [Frankliniella occidentalis]|uniref:TIMELESS-interacting protein n=1 Tax=Frankliniella occidentalis TaxID=133901 RepID=A0A6J1S021_FRAOC|nr:MICAL-like protein 1 [Frankliniella occidentalis]
MAYTVDDLFGRDSLLGDPNDLDNLVEFGDAGNHSDNEVQGGDAGGDDDNEDNEGNKDSDKKPDEKKVIRIKRPQPKLDAERLKGPRGLLQLKKSFADIKFKGKNHEAEDLQRVMARLEHWSHRLFPKFQFDDFIEKVEKLGSKKVVQNYVKRLRMGLEDDDDGVVRGDNEEAVDNPDPVADDTMGEFDRLLAEQVSLHENSLLVSSPRTPGAPGAPRTPSIAPLRPQAVSSTPAQPVLPVLTDEQRARIERNRLAAMEKRRTRLAAMRAGEQEDQQARQEQDAQAPQAPQAPQAHQGTPRPKGQPKGLRGSPRRASVLDAGAALLAAAPEAEGNDDKNVEDGGGGEQEQEAPVPSPPPAPQPAPGPEPSPKPAPEPNPAPERGGQQAVEGEASRSDTSTESSDNLALLAASILDSGDGQLGAGEPGRLDSQGDIKSLTTPDVEICLSESSSSSSGDPKVTFDTTTANASLQNDESSDKMAGKRDLSKSDSSSDDDITSGNKSPSSSCASSTGSSSTKRSADEGKHFKKFRKDADSPVPSEGNSSWGLAAFLDKQEEKSPQPGDEGPAIDYSEEDIEVDSIINSASQ